MHTTHIIFYKSIYLILKELTKFTNILNYFTNLYIVHKDPYENIYCVVSGEKNFILHPPTDLPWIPYRNYPSAVYKECESGKWIIEPIINEISDSEQIANSTLTPWICIDPLNPDYKKLVQI